MTNTPDSAPPVPSHAVAKGFALGLGLLLVGGTAVLITLLVTRNTGTAPVPVDQPIAAIELQVGEKITSTSALEGQALFMIEGPGGAQRVLILDLATGERREIPVSRR
ncbi:hypothetical protein [Parvularcula lutaonensis]|uniref:hypothetical protein n=1 Tax=Parvularcula lutaonensis TaxID=491923 RepID=UPI001E479A1F|nr:hypothetical protein [Parvularcula lutaonensis]